MRKAEVLLLFLLLVSSTAFLPAMGSPEGTGSQNSQENQENQNSRETICDQDSEFTADLAADVRQNLMPLFEEKKPKNLSWREQIFLNHYAADTFPGTVRLGYFTSEGKRLAAYLFKPASKNVKGTVYLLHGYLDHTLSNRHLIKFLLKQNYGVLAFDLPGHGLSEGEPAVIEDFREYSSALNNFFSLSREIRETELSGPVFVAAHSTGCSVLMETISLYEKYETMFDKIILAAPLVQSAGWRFTSLGINLAEPFSDRIFRRFGGSSSNKEYNYFVEHCDPLQSRTVPFSWTHAHAEWVQRMTVLPENNNLLLSIIQGERDSVVDYKFNIPFLLEKYPSADVYRFPDAKHSLFNEIPEIQNSVFDLILDILEKEGNP